MCGINKFPSTELYENANLLAYKNNEERKEKHLKSAFSEDEWRTLIAICRLETANFTSDAYVYGNNFGGLSVNEEPLSYKTKEEGLEAYIENMVTNYFDEGLKTPEEIGSKYCPVNPDWANLINELKEEETEQWEQYLLL